MLTTHLSGLNGFSVSLRKSPQLNKDSKGNLLFKQASKSNSPEILIKKVLSKYTQEQKEKGQSGFCKGFKVLISHRFPSIFGVAKASNERGCGIYDHQQAYRKIA